MVATRAQSQTAQPAASEAELRRCMRDLVALSTLPGIWIKANAREIADSLAQLVVSVLDADFACVILANPAVEIIHSHDRLNPPVLDIARLRADCAPNSICDFDDPVHGPLRAMCLSVGRAPGSMLIALCRRPAFPLETEQVLLRAAAYQATIALDNAERAEQQASLFQLSNTLLRAESLGEVYDAALDAALSALRCSRAAILLFDDSGMMRFVAWRGLTEASRMALEGHSPWTAEEPNPQPICIDDIDLANEPGALKAPLKNEGIESLAFFPLVADGRLVGTFTTYYEKHHAYTDEEIKLSLVIARQLGFYIERERLGRARRRAEDAVRKKDERFRLAVEGAPSGMVLADGEGRIVLINTQAEKLFGYSRHELIGEELEVLLPERFRSRHPGLRAGYKNQPAPRAMGAGRDLFARRKDGTEVPVEIGLSPIMTDEGMLVLAGIVDITARKQAEERQSRLASIIDASRDAILSKSLDGIVTSWNPGAEALFGYSAPEMIGQPIRRIIPIERVAEEDEILGRLKSGQSVEHFETERTTKQGERIPVSITVSPIKDTAGRITGASSVLRDITEIKRTEQTLMENARRQAALYWLADRLQRADTLTAVYDAALDAVRRALNCERVSLLLYDAAGGMRFVAWRGLSDGYRKAVEGHSPWRRDEADPQPVCVEDIDVADFPETVKAAVKAEHVRALAFVPIVASGKLIGKFMTYYDKPHAFNKEERELSVAIARQLSLGIEGRKAEEALRESEKRFRNAQQMSLDAFTILSAVRNAEGTIVDFRWEYVNPVAGRILRSAPEALTGRRVLEVMPGNKTDSDLFQRYVRVVETGEPHDDELRYDSEDIHGWFRIMAVKTDDGVALYFSDVTERRRAAEALRESERRLELALRAGHMGAWQWDIAANRVVWSPGLEEIHGLKPGMFGGTFDDFKSDIHPGDLALVLAEIQGAVSARRDHHVIYRITHPDGSLHWLEAFGKLELGANGVPERMTGVCIDITDRKRAEETEKLLSAELQHRTKNLFAVVQALATRTLRGDPILDDARKTFVGRLQALARSGGRLTNSAWSGASLHDVVKSETELFADRIKAEGSEVLLPPDLTQSFTLAIHELATNAVKYGSLSKPGGEVLINWTVDDDHDGRSLHFQWRERGGPPVTAPKHKGFGTSLLESVLGKGRVEYGAEGLSYTIDLRLGDTSPRQMNA